MPISSFMGLETALSGLEASQEAIQTTSNNITNASTPGYSEETAVLQESVPLTLPGGYGNLQVGTGVDVATVTRASNQYLNNSFRAQNSTASAASTQSATLNQVQAQLNEPSANGLSSQLSAFWTSWSSLANNPASAAASQTVVNDGKNLAQGLDSLSQQLSAVQSQVTQQYTSLTATGGQLQTYAKQIASLNGQIANALAGGANANQLEDQRDQALSNLSALATVSVSTFASGMESVTIGGAATALVSGTTVSWPPAITSPVGGELGAMISLAGSGGQIQSYLTTLDTIANALVSSVNALSPAGTPFFSGSSATTIGVATNATTLQSTVTSNPGVAQAIAGLTGGPADQSYAAFVGQIGSDTQSAQSTDQTSEALLTSITNQVQSVSGVSLDQEMTNLLMYQQGYEASARVMTTVQSLLDTLINQVGAGL